jgi:rhodanese-related sulfurtransferase
MAAWWQRLFGAGQDQGTLRWVTPEALAGLMAQPAPPLILDVRGLDEVAGPLGAIPGSLNLPLGELGSGLDRLPRDRPIVTVCKTDRRSARAAELLGQAGFAEVAVLAGGMERWSAEGRPR